MGKERFRPLAIVGYGCVFPPDAVNPARYWENILQGKKGILPTPSERWNWELFYDQDRKAEDKTYCRLGGFMEDYRFPYSQHGVAPQEVAGFNRTQLMILDTVLQAAAMAGYGREDLKGSRKALFVGNMLGDEGTTNFSLGFRSREIWHWIQASEAFRGLPPEQQGDLEKEFFRAVEQRFPDLEGETALQGSLAGAVGRYLGVGGPTWVSDAACASGLLVIDVASRYLQDGTIDLALVCGAMGNMNVTGNVSFAKIGGLSATHTTPLDERADGLIPGEGAGTILIKRLEDALQQGDKVFGVIRGTASRCDGKGKAIYAPSSRGQVAAMRGALSNAEVEIGDIQYIETHATSTPTGDMVEVESLRELFQGTQLKNKVALGSVKSLTGHTFAAAGMANIIKILLGFERGIMPPTQDFVAAPEQMALDNSPFYVNTAPLEWPVNQEGVRRSLANAFGFGGINSSIVLEDYQPEYHGRLLREYQPGPSQPETSIAIVGVGCLAPGAQNYGEFRLHSGSEGRMATPFPPERWHWDCNPVHNRENRKVGYFITDLDFPWRKFKIPPRVLAQIDRSQQMALMAAEEAMLDWGEDLTGEDTGVFVGSYFGLESGWLSNFRIRRVEYEDLLGSLPAFQALGEGEQKQILEAFIQPITRNIPVTAEDVLPGYMDNIISGRIANILNVRGVNVAIDAGDTSFAAAMEAGIKFLQQGECRSVLVGGVHANLTPEFLEIYERYLREKGQAVSESSLPAEGAAFFVLKRLEEVQDSKRIHGIIRGCSLTAAGEAKAESSLPPGEPNYFGARGAFAMLDTLAAWEAGDGLAPQLREQLGSVTITTYSLTGQEYRFLVETTAHGSPGKEGSQLPSSCQVVYLAGNSLGELLAEARSLLTLGEGHLDEERFGPQVLAGQAFRLSLVYTTWEELRRKTNLFLRMVEKQQSKVM